MKKHLLIAAVTLAAVSAQASKARLNALGNSEHIVDIQEVFSQEPDQALNYEAATIEFGSSTADQEAEAGFIRKMGDSAWSIYLGRNSEAFGDTATAVATSLSTTTGTLNDDDLGVLAAIHGQANPLQLTYASKAGDINWGAGLYYVGNDDKTNDITSGGASFDGAIEQNIAGLYLGANNGVWDAQLRVGLMGEVTSKGTFAGFTNATELNTATELEVTTTSAIRLSGGYLMDTMYFYGSVNSQAGEAKTNTAKISEAMAQTVTVGVVNSHKKDGVDFFYGVSAVIETEEDDTANTKVESTTVPLLVGVEADVASWMTVRASISQPLSLLSSTKAKGTSSTSVDDGTVTALGAGFKWGKATIDTVVKTGTTGEFGSNGNDGDIFGQASVTYNF